jgi:hypothetical protein
LAERYGELNESPQAFNRGRMVSRLDALADAAGASVVANMWPTWDVAGRRGQPRETNRKGGADCMPRTEYCYSCGSEVERYEFTECKACHEYFCADCVNEDELCDQCCESAPREESQKADSGC